MLTFIFSSKVTYHKTFSSGLSPLLWAEEIETEKNCYLGRASFFEKAASQVLLICTDMELETVVT